MIMTYSMLFRSDVTINLSSDIYFSNVQNNMNHILYWNYHEAVMTVHEGVVIHVTVE